MEPAHLQGKAVAIAMTGVSLALSLGVPAGTFLGGALGWQVAFSAMTVLAVVVIVWIAVGGPDFPGQQRDRRITIPEALRIPGVVAVLVVTLVYVLAHTVLYAYVTTFLARVGMADSTDVVLLVFGIASMVSIWLVGAYIDRWLRPLTIVSVALFAVVASVLASLSDSPVLVYIAMAFWGLG
ncbi:MFS transporter [Streptoalloteichus hindustanus]|uniref:Major Facilitator Superfamily protein n=1 Tax=Streptoalloteichus hindustanus TaxID=2017 RepID=A0A1M4XM54_STRHI|nr:MFS transporter [Streptoalloteichus hindustanus]SHE94575.1 Major Facilitator Superfamily protein [Streptoalloteichus hindustanus]